jgi:hypothetical protein
MALTFFFFSSTLGCSSALTSFWKPRLLGGLPEGALAAIAASRLEKKDEF